MKAIWVLSGISEGSGGQRTIFKHAEYLEKKGYKCDFYIKSNNSPEELRKNIEKWYIKFNGQVFNSLRTVEKYDIAFATIWNTVDEVLAINANKKFYFIQDYEPWFYEVGSSAYLLAEQTYNRKIRCITIGRWLSQQIAEKNQKEINYFSFCANLSEYHKDNSIKKEKAICAIFQPDKPRRCTEMICRALQIVQWAHPEIKIYLYGSPKKEIYGLNVEHLGLLSIEECNRLYNKCNVGLCMSASNPSRIPFEMMAAGLPVVELYRKNTIYDFPEDGCLLAENNPESIAKALIKIMENRDLRNSLSDGGEKFMKQYPLERAYEEFYEAIIHFQKAHSKTAFYKKQPVRKDQKIQLISDKIPHCKYFTTDQEKIELEKEEKIRALEMQKNNLEKILMNIENSKAYKMTIKLAKMKNSLKPKK